VAALKRGKGQEHLNIRTQTLGEPTIRMAKGKGGGGSLIQVKELKEAVKRGKLDSVVGGSGKSLSVLFEAREKPLNREHRKKIRSVLTSLT